MTICDVCAEEVVSTTLCEECYNDFCEECAGKADGYCMECNDFIEDEDEDEDEDCFDDDDDEEDF
jgi:hypothetical protein